MVEGAEGSRLKESIYWLELEPSHTLVGHESFECNQCLIFRPLLLDRLCRHCRSGKTRTRHTEQCHSSKTPDTIASFAPFDTSFLCILVASLFIQKDINHCA